MSWAAKRRAMILFIVGAVSIFIIALISIATFYEAPSCADNKQNQGEQGIDCGGPCAYLCTSELEPPTVLFTKAISNGAGRTDVVALVENKNLASAAKDVPVRVALYGEGQVLLQEVRDSIDLPQGTVVPVFVPGVASGKQVVTAAFLTIDPVAPRWFTSNGMRVVPFISGTKQVGTPESPRIEATIGNSTAEVLRNVKVIVLVRDANREVIAASQTVVSVIRPQSTAVATFTWSAPFSGTPASIEVLPLTPLP